MSQSAFWSSWRCGPWRIGFRATNYKLQGTALLARVCPILVGTRPNSPYLRPFILEIDICKRLPVVVAHDKARFLFFDRPGQREAAAFGVACLFGRQISSGASVDNSDNSELRRMSRQHCRTRRATWPQLKGSRGFLSSAQQNAKRGCYLERRVIPIIAVVIMIAPSLAYGSPACMTQSEARAKFPKATHLYMHGSDHCWNDSAVSPEHSPRHSAHAAVLAPSAPPTLAAAPVPSPRPEIINTGIDAGAQCQYSPCE